MDFLIILGISAILVSTGIIEPIPKDNNITDEVKVSKIEEVKESDYVVILDPPEVTLQRSKPKRALMVIMTGFFGLGLGTIIGLIKEYAKNSKQEEKEKVKEAKSLLLIFFYNLIPGKRK